MKYENKKQRFIQLNFTINFLFTNIPYIYPTFVPQCHAGHLVCSNCRPKLTCCPTCRGQLGGNIRNLAMEKVASTVMFPCKYSSGGCSASLLHTEKVREKIIIIFSIKGCRPFFIFSPTYLNTPKL